jgi:hypothetical protein
MGLIREPLDVDFTVEPHILTKTEKDEISEYIRNYKIKEAEKKSVRSAKKRLQKST